MKKYAIPLIIMGLAVLTVILFFIITKPINGAKTPGGYPTQMCKCSGSRILGRCLGIIIDCSYLD